MSENTKDVLAEAAAVAKEFQGRGKFSLAEALAGRGFPTQDVSVYLNEDAGYQLVRLMEQEKPEDQAALEAFNALVQQVADEVEESRLTFSLRGISQGHINQIDKNVKQDFPNLEQDSVEFARVSNYAYMAPHIIRITDYAGDSEERRFTEADVQDLHELLPSSEWRKLTDATHQLSFASGIFEQATDAGFLRKS